MEKKTKQKKNDKQLRRLNREELLEMLISQMEHSENLEKQLESEIRKNDKTNLIIKESGSMAEALLKLNGVFDATEVASNEYLELLKIKGNSEIDSPEKIIAEAKEKAEKILAETKTKCRKLLKETKIKCDEMLRQANGLLKKQESSFVDGSCAKPTIPEKMK